MDVDAPWRSSTLRFTHFGQQIDSDICTEFEASFPHQFVAMLNFKDRWGSESWVYFLQSANSEEVTSSLAHLHSTIEHRLVDGIIGRWVTDSGKAFLSTETHELAEELTRARGMSVPYRSNTLPVAERHVGAL